MTSSIFPGPALACGRKLPSGVLLAPMEGVMTPRFVKAAHSLGLVDVWMAPFISVPAGAVPSKAAIRRRLEAFSATGLPVIPQILGRDPESVAECARRMAILGHEFISLNFACPSPIVIRGGSGGSLLKRPELLLRILRAVIEAVAGRAAVIVKMRTGWASPAESGCLLPAVREAGASACILHFRTVQEGYMPVADGLSRLSRAAVSSGVMPLIGNGDIRSVDDAVRMRSETPCAGVALARGFLSDPYILRRLLGLESPPLEEGRRLFLDAMRGVEGKPAKGNLLEIAKEMYGEGDERFRKMLAD